MQALWHQYPKFVAWLIELNDFLPLFTGSDDYYKMEDEDTNEILIHSDSNAQKKSYIKVFRFDKETCRDDIDLFEIM